ncbi:DUF3889 domain-containing protein [Paenibacillus arenilitoris]|uniref:DUF3889 domain-containing protein n=1 Tax=Paenibacillus arenilitoris TaxID=2772299 RepID=A0A927H813_9BACL|nr:DUF3889 domain-containing protein [Paenibacillus arenilitoris]MBD2871203.1 DUF3889 domain-containing protein [Paenibacillus arenilitoris]
MLRHFVMKAVFVLLSLTHSEAISSEEAALIAEPSYAKWGRLAMEETAKAYQGASIVDYKYEGRTKLEGGQAEERFVLRLQKGSREFGIRVSLKVNADTDRLVQVRMMELAP